MPPPEFLGKVRETQRQGDIRIFKYITKSRPGAKS